MVKFYAFILSLLSFIWLAAPAYAGRLLFWRFEENQNRLVFTTDQGIQPTAQLIANPTRLVIDLPGTVLGRPTINERYRGLITSVRIGQFSDNVTRVVVEVAPGYTLDPKQIKIKGISPTQWSVDLPTPQRGGFPGNTNNNDRNQSIRLPNRNLDNNQNRTPITQRENNNSFSGDDGLQVTSSGLVVGIDGDYKNKITVNRSDDRRQIKIDISDLKVANNLIKSWQVNKYGISELSVDNQRNGVTLTLNVNPDSPDWRASFTRTGGLLLWPQGGISRVRDLSVETADGNDRNGSNTSSQNQNPPDRNPIRTIDRSSNNNSGNIASLDSLKITFNQLLIKSDKPIQAQANWNSANQVYQIRLENTRLSENFQNPTLPKDSPIDRLRISQPDDKTVVLLVETARNVEIQRLNQLTNNLWSLALNQTSVQRAIINPLPPGNINPWDRTPTGNTGNISINVDPAPPQPNPPRNPINPPPNKGRLVVVIDPGHGGKDPGAVGIGGLQEKRINMIISQEVTRLLEQQGIQVRMTRNSDYFVSLKGRTDFANRLNADLFVSIHANSAGKSKPHVSGYETFYFQSGRGLAATIHRNVIRKVNVRDRKLKQARFYVLRNSKMPSALVEVGFLTGREDAAKLRNPTFQKQMAQAIASGIVEYIKTNRL